LTQANENFFDPKVKKIENSGFGEIFPTQPWKKLPDPTPAGGKIQNLSGD